MWHTHKAGLVSLTLAASMLLGLTAVAQADQGEIAYIANDGRTIHVVQSDGSGDHVLVTAPAVVSFAWSPDGKTLAYATLSTPFGPGIQRQSQRIFLLDATTGSSTELHSSTGTYGPIAFLPDGKRLAAQAGQGPTVICQGGIVSIALDTGRASPLAPVASCLEHLQFAPDGGGLIATTHSGDPSSGVQNIALPGGASTWIEDPATGTLGFSGTVSADNQTLAYITVPGTDLRNPGQLVLTDRQGSNPRAVWPVQADQHLRDVAFSPDASQLAVGIRTGDTNDENIWVGGIDGSGSRTIASGRLPAWRPAGNGAAMGTGAAAPEPSPATGDQPAPDALTDGVRADILAAVDRANTAWTTASQSLDPSVLDGNVAGQELSDDRAELDKLRSQGHTQTNTNTGFTVVEVSVDAPGHAIVHTQETWSAEPPLVNSFSAAGLPTIERRIRSSF
jgi:dipeptidyl aminopeptidase/acylaminoacyl peptidase